MTTSLTWLGHASFEVRHEDQIVLIDPFLTDNPVAQVGADDLQATAILLTHGHGDHVGDTISIAKRCGAVVVANYEICNWLQDQGLSNVHPMHIGGSHQFDFGTVKLTIAHHGSALPDGSNGGSPAGILLQIGDALLYFAGDTGLFMDMQLIGNAGLDVAVLPIGDNFTMGPADSVTATGFLKPRKVVPCHYNTWPLIEQDAAAWASEVSSKTNATPVVLEIGQSMPCD